MSIATPDTRHPGHPDLDGRAGALRSQIVERLIGEIVSRRIQPGEKLAISKLADQFGVSATPVREALIELSETGVVEWQTNRGALCRPFGPRQIRELYDLRRLLETEALRRSYDHLGYEELVDLRHRTQQMASRGAAQDFGQAYDADRGLHRLLANRCQNERLAHELHRYDGLMAAMCRSVHNADDSLTIGLTEHVEIIDSLLAGDPERARLQLGHHIVATGHRIAGILFPQRRLNAP